MKCLQVLESLSDYIDDMVDADQGDAIDIHLESCPACKACLNTLQRTIDFCKDTAVAPLGEQAIGEMKSDAAGAFERAYGGKSRG